MKIVAVYCIYNEENYIEYSIKSIYDFVDKIIICLSQAPYIAYNSKARDIVKSKDKTEEIVNRLARNDKKIKIIDGVWDSEVEHRNAAIKYCIDNNYDYYFLIDADEMYRKDHLEAISREIAAHPEIGTFVIKCAIFWRSFRYRIPAEKVAWCPRRIFKVTTKRKILGIKFPYNFRFIGENKTNSLGEVYHIPSNKAIFYHFSYAKTFKDMKEKLSTFSHAHQILDGWYEKVWLKWPQNRQMPNIHPTNPEKFPMVECVDPKDLPDVIKNHPYYDMDIIE